MPGRGQMCNFSWVSGNVENSPVKDISSMFMDPQRNSSSGLAISLMGSSRGCPEAQRGQGLAHIRATSLCRPDTGSLAVPGSPWVKAEVKVKAVPILVELRVPCVKVACPTGRQPSECP